MGIAKEVVIGCKDAIKGRTPHQQIRHTPARMEAGGAFSTLTRVCRHNRKHHRQKKKTCGNDAIHGSHEFALLDRISLQSDIKR